MKANVAGTNYQKPFISEEIMKRLLIVPMVRFDYTVKDAPEQGQSLPKSVRVCDLNHVRYFLGADMNIGTQNALYNRLRHFITLKRQFLHVYNPYLKKIVVLIPQRIFQERKEDVFDPIMMAHPEWKKEFDRFVEVSGLGEIPKMYQFPVDSYAITEGERAYYDWKKENKDHISKTGTRPNRVSKSRKGGAA